MTDKIESGRDYDAALLRAESLWGAQDGTPESKELSKLVALIKEYEAAHYLIDPSSKEAAAKYRREQPMRLVMYSDNERHGEYVWFYVNSHDRKVSDDFKSVKEAQEWLKNME